MFYTPFSSLADAAVLGFLRFNHCSKCAQVYRAIKFYYIVESRTVWPNLWRVVNLIHILLILAHWFGCFYFLLSEVEGFQVSRKIKCCSGGDNPKVEENAVEYSD